MFSRSFAAPLVAALMVSAAGALPAAAAAHAAAPQADFHIPAQPLAGALTSFARQADVQIFFPAASIKGLMAPAIDGRMSRQAALRRLIAGSRLTVRQDDGKTVVLGEADNAEDETPVAAAQSITVIGHAQTLAPSSMPGDVTQPTSVIQENFIANNIVPLASIDDVIKFQPSVWTQNPNGPGIGKAEEMVIRGFADGQYNMTFDGIPFGDSSDLHHTTSSLFIAHALKEAQIDRGPGTASTIGKATFGGSVGFLSKDPLKTFDIDAYGTAGSFNTLAGGGRIDSGQMGPVRLFAEAQHEQTDGYLTHSNENRDNFMGKAIIDVSAKTKITAMANWNREFQYTTQGATLAEYAKYGNNYGLCGNAAAMCYYGYQPSHYYSDFEYVRLNTSIGNVLVDNNLYHNGFVHSYIESSDASDDNTADNGVTFYSATTIGKKVATYSSDIKGKLAHAKVSTWGDTLRVTVPGKIVDIKTGLWLDFQHDDRYSETVDWSQNLIPVTGKYGTAYSYQFSDLGTTVQPYLELVVRPIDGLVLNPGVRYTSYNRTMYATVNKGTNAAAADNVTYHAVQPSIAANYTILPGWTAYAQAARGFLAPPVAVFQVNQVGSLKPETTWNYQLGTVAHGHHWSVSFDGYYINFSNYLSSLTTGGQTYYGNTSGAIYKGLELEGQVVVAKGLSLYGNATLNSAKYKGVNVTLEEAPEWTAAAGILYEDKHGPYASLIGKAVGPRWGNDTTGTYDDPSSYVGTTFTADLAAGWHFSRFFGMLRNVTPSVKIGNLFNSHAISDYAGTQSATNAALFWRTPGRSFFFNLEAHL
ncbi:MAG TPA: TonB-dependent receptor [Novosphingobium sp.]|nr:TonB-dependent receptor [Novosphingobium sp.]